MYMCKNVSNSGETKYITKYDIAKFVKNTFMGNNTTYVLIRISYLKGDEEENNFILNEAVNTTYSRQYFRQTYFSGKTLYIGDIKYI